METPHIHPPPQALHGPLPDDGDPSLYYATTEDHAIPIQPANESFVSIFNWITRKFNKKAHRDGGPDVHSRATSMTRTSRGFSLLSPLRRSGYKGQRISTAVPSGQLPGTEMAELQPHEPATMSPQSHMSPVLKPGPDYAKMDNAGSGPSEDPLVGRLTKVRSFIREVQDLPWVATDRVTIDYYPGKVRRRPQVQLRPPQGPRHVRSWYSERTSGLLPFTVVPEGNTPSPLTHVQVTPPLTEEPEDRSEGNDTVVADPQDDSPTAQQQSALKYPEPAAKL